MKALLKQAMKHYENDVTLDFLTLISRSVNIPEFLVLYSVKLSPFNYFFLKEKVFFFFTF